ncbi:MAG: hypothetical protein LBC44_01035 [Mycoplasmataceae bacterium]|jgi:alanine dehydrogenase|nr:hypothetical protein [Mycoplasmataceae bacterium]
MKIIVLKETIYENRVALIPSDVSLLTKTHEVYIEHNLANHLGYFDKDYENAGAKIFSDIDQKHLLPSADIVIKFSCLLKKELKFIKPSTIVINNVYLANNPKILKLYLKTGVKTVGMELIQKNGHYEFLSFNEQIKGKYGAMVGAFYLNHCFNKIGYGKSFGELKYIKNSVNYTVLNYSYAALETIKTALAFGSHVTLLESNEEYINYVKQNPTIQQLCAATGSTFNIVPSDFDSIFNTCKTTDVLINTTQVPGAKTKLRITSDMIVALPKGAVFVDLGADQGFGSEVTPKPTNPKKGFDVISGHIVVCLEDIPSYFPQSLSECTSKFLTNNLLAIPTTGSVVQEFLNHPELKSGFQTYDGKIVNKEIGESLNLDYEKI